MTVALLAKWGSQPPGTLYTSDAATEAAMIAAKQATATLTGATVWPPAPGAPGGAGSPGNPAPAAAAVTIPGAASFNGSNVSALRAALQQVYLGPTSAKTFVPAFGSSSTSSPANGFAGGIYVPETDEMVLCPHSSTVVGIVNCNTMAYTAGPTHGQGSTAFASSTRLTDGRILFIPYNANNFVLFDPVTRALTVGPAHGKTEPAFTGSCLLPNGDVICAPHTSPNVGIYRVATNSYEDGPVHGAGGGAFECALLMPNGIVIFSPLNATNIGLYDSNTGLFSSGPAHGQGAQAYQGCTLAPGDLVILTPFSNTAGIGRYNWRTGGFALSAAAVPADGAQGYCCGKMTRDGRLVMFPRNSANWLVYDVAADTYVKIAHDLGAAAGVGVGGIITPAGRVICAPFSVAAAIPRYLDTFMSFTPELCGCSSLARY